MRSRRRESRSCQGWIEGTIQRLEAKTFLADPIAGPHFSKITSVMSSAYKRHGSILERALLEALEEVPALRGVERRAIPRPRTVDHMVNGSIAHGAKLIGTDYPYSEGERTLQVDVIVFDKNTGILRAYEIKRGFGMHDSGKQRSMLRDTLGRSSALEELRQGTRSRRQGGVQPHHLLLRAVLDPEAVQLNRARVGRAFWFSQSTRPSRKSTSTTRRGCS